MLTYRDSTMEKPSRTPIFQSREDFNNTFLLHIKQPWTAKKHDELFALLQECDNPQESRLVLDLLSAYENFDEQRTTMALSEMQNTITSDWKLAPQNTLIVALHNDHNPGSAQAILQSLKSHFDAGGWRGNNFISHLNPAIERIKSGMNVVFVDDFIGTGTQFCTSYDLCFKKLEHQGKSCVNFYLTSLVIMCQAIEKLEKRNVQYFATHYMEKGISDRYHGQNLNEAKTHMTNLENKLNWINKEERQKLSFGFLQSEALFRHMENNGPNNNFPIFWRKKTSKGKRRFPIQKRL